MIPTKSTRTRQASLLIIAGLQLFNISSFSYAFVSPAHHNFAITSSTASTISVEQNRHRADLSLKCAIFKNEQNQEPLSTHFLILPGFGNDSIIPCRDPLSLPLLPDRIYTHLNSCSTCKARRLARCVCTGSVGRRFLDVEYATYTAFVFLVPMLLQLNVQPRRLFACPKPVVQCNRLGRARALMT